MIINMIYECSSKCNIKHRNVKNCIVFLKIIDNIFLTNKIDHV